MVYATGLGPTNPAASTGSLGAAAEPLNRVVDLVSVEIGQGVAAVLYAGLAPGMQGIYQVNLMPNPVLGNALTLSAGNYLSTPVTVPVAAGANVSNATGSIDGLYPASGAMAVQYGGGNATSGPIGFSALLLGGTFTASFDILPAAKPFQVVATVTAQNAAGSVTGMISIDPVNHAWRATYTVPALPSRSWDFSNAGFVVTDFLAGGYPFPGNVIPLHRVDPIAYAALNILAQPNTLSPATGANGTYSTSGALPADGHFVIGAGVLPQLSNFGGFTNLLHVSGSNAATFHLFVDNLEVASKSVPFTVY